MPNGFGAVLSAMLITMFSFMGAEIVTIAAAESRYAGANAIVRATNSGITANFHLLPVFHFVVVALIRVEYAGSLAAERLVRAGAASYSRTQNSLWTAWFYLSVTVVNSAYIRAGINPYSLAAARQCACGKKLTVTKTHGWRFCSSLPARQRNRYLVNYYAPAKVFKFLIDSSAPSRCWSIW
ncbi:hypothetical protein KCP74_11490 [Salmonella enterica subsp. enterica]|nr:hypothetical protein KCP74_11490 [Salmonella enterica subsp. enterica]